MTGGALRICIDDDDDDDDDEVVLIGEATTAVDSTCKEDPTLVVVSEISSTMSITPISNGKRAPDVKIEMDRIGAPSLGTNVIVFLSLTGPEALPLPTACNCHRTRAPSSPPEKRYEPSFEKESAQGACECQCTSDERNDEPPVIIVGEDEEGGNESAEPDGAKENTA